MTNTIPIKPINSKFNDEQWRAIHYRGQNLLVSASAGSGKTTVLIERILNHLQSNFANINELLVVTFTEAAAKEMKERMEVRLKEAVNQSNQSDVQQDLIKQINGLPNAHIRTLHSFCLNVIQTFFYLIDFNPSFTLVTDETEITLMYEQVWQDLVAAIYENEFDSFNQDDFMDLLSRYSEARTDDGLSSLVIDLYKFSSSHPEPELWLRKITEETKLDEFVGSDLFNLTIKKQLEDASMSGIKILENAISFLETLSTESIDKYQAVLSEDLNQLKQLYNQLQAKDLEAVLATINAIKFTKWPSNSKKSDDYEAIVELKDLRDSAKDITSKRIITLFKYPYKETREIEDRLQEILGKISQLTLKFRQKLKDYKIKKNIIDYNDLEHLTLDILATFNPETEERQPSIAARYYQSLFKEVMVDEYQDINEIQATILSYLSHERIPEESGNLFMVGDVKQSIYGFRMAEPSLFLEKYRKYMQNEGGHLIILDKNYRSRDEVLQFTNYLFERIMDIDFGEMEYSQQEALTTGNHSFIPTAPAPKYNIDLILYEKESLEEDDLEFDESIPLIDSSIEAESHIIAQDIYRRIRDKEMVYDKDLKTERPVKLSDFVVLSSTRKPFLIMQRIFENYQIPLFAQKIENYFQRQEVQVMIALLKIIDNPMQDIPLVAVLRSYFVGLSDEELSQIRINGMEGNFYEATLKYINGEGQGLNKNLLSKLNEFLSKLREWSQLAQKISLVELIWTIYQETDYLDYVAGLSNGIQRQANLHALYERANDFEDSQYKGLFGFIRYIERIMDKENDLAEPVLLSPDSNYVRLMTVHASKGLEFPIVYIMNSAKRFNLSDTKSSYIASKNYGLATDLYEYSSLFRFESIRKTALKIEKENKLKAEEMRKLYVALTRCEQKLIIVGSINSREKWDEKLELVKQQTDGDQLLVPSHFRQTANSWLDWIGQSLAISPNHGQSVTSFTPNQVDIHFINNEQIMTEEYQNSYQVRKNPAKWLEDQKDSIKLTNSQEELKFKQNLERLFHYKYPYSLSVNTSSYQSVSELKRLYEEPRIERIDYYADRRFELEEASIKMDAKASEGIKGIRYTEDSFEHPSFKQEEDGKLSSSEIGTATHYLLQRLNFEEFENLKTDQVKAILKSQARDLVSTNELSSDLAVAINFNHLSWLIQTELGQELIGNYQSLNREEAFSYLVTAKDLFANRLSDVEMSQLNDDQILIHGVIDNYIEFEDGITLIDYKTDRYKAYSNKTRDQQIQILKSRYQFQLKLYAQALETAKRKKVKSVKLVLLDFNEVIEL